MEGKSRVKLIVPSVPRPCGSHSAEALVMDDLGERLPGLRRVGASAVGTDVLEAEGERGPDQPLTRDTQDVLDRLPALAVEPADRGPQPMRLGGQLESLAEHPLVEGLLLDPVR